MQPQHHIVAGLECHHGFAGRGERLQHAMASKLYRQLQLSPSEHGLAQGAIHPDARAAQWSVDDNFFRPHGGHTVRLCPNQRWQRQGLTQQQTLGLLQLAHLHEIVAADKTRNEAVLWILVNQPRAAHLLHHAIEHDANLVRDRQGFFLVVGHIDGGNTKLLLQLADVAPQFHPQLGIKVGERLIHQQHLGANHQGTRQAHALLLPAAELVRHALGQLIELHRLQNRGNPLADVRCCHFLLHQTKCHVVKHIEVRKHRIVLKHHAHLPLVRTQRAN